MGSYLSGQKIAFLTQHGKEQVVRPVMEAALGCQIEHITGFDTDSLGTFTRDIPRQGSQLEAARQKVRMGMSLSGLPVGIASEGSFGPDPFTGMITWNVEVLILLDDRNALEIVGMSQAAALCGELLTSDWKEASSFAAQHGFPSHQLVLRSDGRPDGKTADLIHKGIADWETFKTMFETAASQSESGKVLIESDLRAFANPTRMQNIRLAATNLVARLQSLCPQCEVAGFWATEAIRGLPCAVCHAPTPLAKGELWQCVSCGFTENRLKPETASAEAKHCSYCNP